MYGYVLQDWITINGSSTAAFIQNEGDWMGFSSFQDIAFWVDVRAVNLAGGAMTMVLQTSPTKDDVLFQTLSNCTLNITTVSTPYTTAGALPKTILSSNPGVPLSTWVRWQVSNSITGWSLTFRILCAANRTVSG